MLTSELVRTHLVEQVAHHHVGVGSHDRDRLDGLLYREAVLAGCFNALVDGVRLRVFERTLEALLNRATLLVSHLLFAHFHSFKQLRLLVSELSNWRFLLGLLHNHIDNALLDLGLFKLLFGSLQHLCFLVLYVALELLH